MKIRNTNNINLPELTQRLKTSDTKYASMVRVIQIMYFILIPIYILLTIIHLFSGSSIFEIAGSLCFILSMTIFAFITRNYYKEYNNVDYSQPTLIMLKKAAYRYKPFQRRTLWALLALIIMGAGLTLNNLEFNAIRTIIFFTILIVMSLIAGLIWWYFRYKPLRDAALQLIREIENE